MIPPSFFIPYRQHELAVGYRLMSEQLYVVRSVNTADMKMEHRKGFPRIIAIETTVITSHALDKNEYRFQP